MFGTVLRSAAVPFRRAISSPLVHTRSYVRSKPIKPAAHVDEKPPVKVAITGAAGNIGYSLVFRIASGEMLGYDQPVILHLLEITPGLPALKGVSMELLDCAFPLLRGIVQTDDAYKGFEDIDYALLVGARPRGPGMERADLMKANAAIFLDQGKALNKVAKRDVKVVVVGNPANTNALIVLANAPELKRENITAMTRLDHNRAMAQVALRTNTTAFDIEKVCIWGNHSNTQFPDLTFATIHGEPALSVINDEHWVKDIFIPTVQKRGAEIIAARKLSSAASAGNAALDHIRDWAVGYDHWVSMAVPSNGEYGAPKDVIFSYPVVCTPGKYELVKDLPLSAYQQTLIERTGRELVEERDMVRDFMP